MLNLGEENYKISREKYLLKCILIMMTFIQKIKIKAAFLSPRDRVLYLSELILIWLLLFYLIYSAIQTVISGIASDLSIWEWNFPQLGVIDLILLVIIGVYFNSLDRKATKNISPELKGKNEEGTGLSSSQPSRFQSAPRLPSVVFLSLALFVLLLLPMIIFSERLGSGPIFLCITISLFLLVMLIGEFFQTVKKFKKEPLERKIDKGSNNEFSDGFGKG